MKKLIIFLLGASLIVSACDNMVEVDDTQSNRFDLTGMDVFTAESENPSGHTKTILNQDGGIDWQPGDSIHIFKGKSDCGAFVATIEEQAITSDFIGQLDYSEEDKDGAYWAIYPYSKDNTCDGKSVTVHIPAKQVATEGTFDKKAFVSVAHSDKQTLSFYNVCGGVKISVTAPDIKRIVFKGNAGETLAGDATVSMDENGRPVVQSITNPRTEITLEAPAEKTFEVGKWYYLSCLPDSLAKGCSVLFHKENDFFSAEADYSIDKPIVIKRSIWGRIQDSDDEAICTILPDDGLIIYTTTNNKAIVIDSSLFVSHIYKNGSGIIKLKDSTVTLMRNWYWGSLKYVGIGKGVTSIGSYAFSDCSNLISITIPEGVTSIGSYAFSGCSSLTSITIPGSVTSIDESAFSGCSSLTNIIIGDGVTSIGAYAFSGCRSLTSITIPGSVTNIGGHAFSDCRSLTSITIPGSVTNIGSSAFYGCNSLRSFNSPYASEDKRCLIKDGVLIGFCPAGLESYTIPSSVTSIGINAFSGCSSLTSITIPGSVTSIGGHAFSGCRSLISITIPEGVTSIGSYAFADCSSLTSITIPGSVTNIGYSAFSGCNSLLSFNSPYASEDKRCLVVDGWLVGFCPAGLESYTFPSSVTRIGHPMLSGYTGSISITIPESVTDIGSYAFSGYTGLKSVTIPNSISKINNGVFHGCTGLTQVTIPSEVTSIGSYAFYNCSSLTSITIPDSVTDILDYAFYKCSSLTSITIGKGVKSIRSSAFYGCSSLTEITVLRSSPPNLYASSFEATNITAIYVPAESVNAYKSAYFWRLWGNIIKAILPEAIDLGLSVKWASCNLGTIKPEEYGDYYAWGETEPKENYSWSTYKFGTSFSGPFSKYNTISSYGSIDNKTVLEPEDDVAHVKLGGKWRMPTDAEWTELMAKCTWTWVTNYNGSGINGRLVEATNGNSIFLPAAGYRLDADLDGAGSYGYYWSSSLNTDRPHRAWDVSFNSDNVYSYHDHRYFGRSLRPVCD